MGPIEFMGVLKRHRRVLLLGMALGVVVAAAMSALFPPSFNFRATDLVVGRSPQELSRLAALVAIQSNSEEVAEEIEFAGTAEALAARVRADADVRTGLLAITGTANDPAEAESIAHAFTDQLISFVGGEDQGPTPTQLRAAATQLEQEISALEFQIRRAKGSEKTVLEAERDAKLEQYQNLIVRAESAAAEGPPAARLQIVQRGTAQRDAPNFLSTRVGQIATGAFLGLLAAILTALGLDSVDMRIRTRKQAEESFGLPILAEMPRDRSADRGLITSLVERDSAVATGYRHLAAALFTLGDRRLGDRSLDPRPRGQLPNKVAISSPEPGEGRSTATANLAVTLAELGHQVLVISCDFRNTNLEALFQVEGQPGMTDALVDPYRERMVERYVRPTPVPSVRILPSGTTPGSPAEIISSATFKSLLKEAAADADILLLDTGPLTGGDAPFLLQEVDAVIVLCRAGSTTTTMARFVKQLLDRFGVSSAGLVLLNAPKPSALD